MRSWIAPVRHLFDGSMLGPAWVGLGIALGYLLLRVLFDAAYVMTIGFPAGESPLWEREQWWTDAINGAQIGYLPAALAILRRGAARDLVELRSRFDCSDSEFSSLVREGSGPGGPIALGLSLVAIMAGALGTFVDPTFSGGAEPSLTAPDFVWAVGRMMLLSWLLARFAIDDVSKTRAFMRMGRHELDVDLLDVRSLAPLARRGQRSALAWVLFSTIVSLFWLGDSASDANIPLLVIVMSLATFAFVGPLLALHRNVTETKRSELDRLRGEIRNAQNASDAATDSPRLANVAAYYQLVESAREWPINAASLLKFFGYLLLGLGSWLGGAVVERVLDTALG
jgi:hypothetical protein